MSNVVYGGHEVHGAESAERKQPANSSSVVSASPR
ncbi:hypothetical protein PSP31121_05487 [Pandoraea sputorum]|uniref:Uncharacterized protein n=1 Tax=Pandoraea sputorum TaxID=93222 RepID=A0A5E5BJH5_9BURK|nr:hypothetical protein PSP31121_05487 [Pandoraea sputorum]